MPSPRPAGSWTGSRPALDCGSGWWCWGGACTGDRAHISRHDAGGLLVPYVHWERMLGASYRGDAEATALHANQVEANRGDWWAAGAAHFLAEAADCLDRVGYTAQAASYLWRAQAEQAHGAGRIVAMAECALLARHGDPTVAEERLAAVHRHGIYPRERWRVMLMRAYAAWRRGDAATAGQAAQALEEAPCSATSSCRGEVAPWRSAGPGQAAAGGGGRRRRPGPGRVGNRSPLAGGGTVRRP